MGKLRLFFASQIRWRRLLVIVIIALYGWAFLKTAQNTEKCTPLWGYSSESIYAAISELKYGAKPFHTYQKVKEVMWNAVADSIAKRNGRNECGPDISSINRGINEALQLNDLGPEVYTSTSTLGSELPGYAMLCKIGFFLFGFKFWSIFYAYWLLLIIPAIIILIGFYDKNAVLYVLFLYSIALSAVLQTQGFLEEGVLRGRHFTILTILPVFYLVLIMVDIQREKRWFIYFGAVMQSLILGWVVFTRPSGLYQFIHLSILTVAFFIYKLRKNGWRGAAKIVYPIILVLVCYGTIRSYGSSQMGPNSLIGRGCIYHPYLLGLGVHPDAMQKHGLAWSDLAVIDIVKRHAPEYGLVWDGVFTDFSREKNIIVQCSKEYETILRDEYFRIFKQDPWFVVSAYYYGLVKYFKLYFTPLRPGAWTAYHNFGILDVIKNYFILTALIVAVLFRMTYGRKIKLQPVVLFVVGFLFAIPIPILVYPVNHVIADSSLYLTVFLFAVFIEGSIIVLRFLQIIISKFKSNPL